MRAEAELGVGRGAPCSGTRLCTIGVDGYEVDARIGVHSEEHERRQRLIVSVTLTAAMPEEDNLAMTFDYAAIPRIIEEVAAVHTKLIERFADRIARLCLPAGSNVCVTVRVNKPTALRKGLAWTEVTLHRNAC